MPRKSAEAGFPPRLARRAVDHESEVLESYVTKKQTQKSSFKVYEESHAALWISQLDRY